MFSPDEWSGFFRDLEAVCVGLDGPANIKTSLKIDRTPVTAADLALSDFMKGHPLARGFHFHSEEEHSDLRFPALILDPIDGTREYTAGRPECAFSAAWMRSPELGAAHAAVVYNPFTGFRLASGMSPRISPLTEGAPWQGMVSRSEWEQGLYEGKRSVDWTLTPRGSIAFKLALLASGACDFVVSLRPKNVWDIAAGTLLAHERGMVFWSAGVKIDSLDRENYPAPLIWAPPAISASLLESFPV